MFLNARVPSSENFRARMALYTVRKIPKFKNCFIGTDWDGQPCILIALPDANGRLPPPIKFESIEVQFQMLCRVKQDSTIYEEKFTIIKCISSNRALCTYFLSICNVLLGIIKDKSAISDIAEVIIDFASLFRKIQNPCLRVVNGLFGELYLLLRCHTIKYAMLAWRSKNISIFDFSVDNIRIDMKTTSSGIRCHTFSYEQCNPPHDTLAFVGSLFVQRTNIGVSLYDLIKAIEKRCGSEVGLVMKLHKTIIDTLGETLADSLSIRFDLKVAAASLQFYDLRGVPALRCDIPSNVHNIHFQSDLSEQVPVQVHSLERTDNKLKHLMPS